MYGHVIVFGHVFGHVTWEALGDHVICHVMGHMMFSWDHVPVSQDHMEVSSSLLSGYSLALGLGWVDLGVSRMIPSRGGVAQAKPATLHAFLMPAASLPAMLASSRQCCCGGEGGAGRCGCAGSCCAL